MKKLLIVSAILIAVAGSSAYALEASYIETTYQKTHLQTVVEPEPVEVVKDAEVAVEELVVAPTPEINDTIGVGIQTQVLPKEEETIEQMFDGCKASEVRAVLMVGFPDEQWNMLVNEKKLPWGTADNMTIYRHKDGREFCFVSF